MKAGRYYKVTVDGKYYATTGLDALVKILKKFGLDRVTFTSYPYIK